MAIKDQSGDVASNDRNYHSDSPGTIGITSDRQTDLAAPMAGATLNVDNDEAMTARNGPSDTGDDGRKRPS